MKTAINLALIFSCSPSVNDGGEKKKKKSASLHSKEWRKKKKRAHSSVEQSASRDLLE